MSAIQSDAPTSELRLLPTAQIDPNPGNPRLIFPQDELDRLADSIANEGILVPIVVFEKEGRYVLVDGERRFKCALTLGLENVPAVITTERTEQQLLVQMFNIHLIREPWRDMPTAKALGRLIEELRGEEEAEVSDSQLRALTGMSTERIKQLRFALQLPQEWQEHIETGRVPLNWFWELDKNVIRPLSKERPQLLAELGEHNVRAAFVEKRLEGITATDTVSLRKVRPIISFAAADAGQHEGGTSRLDGTLRNLISQPNFTIEEAYEDTVQFMVETDKLQRRTDTMLANFDRLLGRAQNIEEREYIKNVGREFIANLNKLLT